MSILATTKKIEEDDDIDDAAVVDEMVGISNVVKLVCAP
jgi:hypothetical protein